MTSQPPGAPIAGAAADPAGAAAPAPEDAGVIHVPQAQDVSPPPRRHRWVSVLIFVGWLIALPIAAFGIGLLVAWIVHEIRGDHIPSRAGSPPVSAPARSSASAAAPKPKPEPVAPVPADWVTEVAPPVGLTFRHPPGWIRRTATPEVLRFAPGAAESTTPGIDGVGAGVEPAAEPAGALQAFTSRAYANQPAFTTSATLPVVGHHPGEQVVTVTYRRSGVVVQVVAHSFRSGPRTVVVLGRAPLAQAGRAAQLEALVEASLQIR